MNAKCWRGRTKTSWTSASSQDGVTGTRFSIPYETIRNTDKICETIGLKTLTSGSKEEQFLGNEKQLR